MNKKRVVITGMGAVTPLGCDVETLWKNLLKGSSGVSQTTIFDASTFPTQFSAQVNDYDPLAHIPQTQRTDHKDAARNSRFMIGAAIQA